MKGSTMAVVCMQNYHDFHGLGNVKRGSKNQESDHKA